MEMDSGHLASGIVCYVLRDPSPTPTRAYNCADDVCHGMEEWYSSCASFECAMTFSCSTADDNGAVVTGVRCLNF